MPVRIPRPALRTAPQPQQPAAQTGKTAPAPTSIQLCAGQRYHLWSGREAIVLVQAGTVRLQEPPYWVATQLLDIQTDLYEGQHYLIQRSGWTCLQASRDCELLYYPGPVLGQVSLTWLCTHASSAMQVLRSWLQRRRPALLGETKQP